MDEPIEFCVNRASVSQLVAHLSHCDVDFVPPLSGRVNIESYAQKIANTAIRFEAWAGGELAGLVAAYCNDDSGHVAFITSVSVRSLWQGRGIASRLLACCRQHARGLGFVRIELEVDSRNHAAIRVYERHRFAPSRINGYAMIMSLVLEEGSAGE